MKQGSVASSNTVLFPREKLFYYFVRLDEASTSRQVSDKAADYHTPNNQSSKSVHSDYPKGSRLKTHHHHHHHHHPHSSVKYDKTKRK